MRHHSKILDGLAITVTFMAVILQWLNPDLVQQIRYPILILVVITVGIPHGAIDHIITSTLYNLSYTFREQIYFYIYYLIMMLVMIGFWWLNPMLGFLLFMIISIYHFGEADLEYLSLPKYSKVLLYFARGTMIIGLIIFGHPQYTSEIIQEITDFSLLNYPFIANYSTEIALFFIGQYLLTKLFLLIQNRNYIQQSIWYPMLDGIIVAILFFQVDTILAFSIYFGLWHSVGHIRAMISHLQKEGKPMNISGFFKKALPFTLITFGGILLLYYLNQAFGMEEQMVSLFFILISVITLPHMLIVFKMFGTYHSEKAI